MEVLAPVTGATVAATADRANLLPALDLCVLLDRLVDGSQVRVTRIHLLTIGQGVFDDHIVAHAMIARTHLLDLHHLAVRRNIRRRRTRRIGVIDGRVVIAGLGTTSGAVEAITVGRSLRRRREREPRASRLGSHR